MRKIIVLICALLCTITLFAQTGQLEEQLIKASTNGDFLTVQTLVNTKGIDINARYNGDTALVNASFAGHLDIVKELLSHKDININKTGNLNVTPLIGASVQGYTEIVKELLKHSPKLNKQDKYGYTALMYAAEKGYKSIVHELVINGADVTIVKKNKVVGINNALLLAYNNNHRDITMELLKAELHRNLSDLLTLENYKSKYYNAIDESKNTLLMLASKKGDIEIVNFLVNINKEQTKLGKAIIPIVDINKKDFDNNTALMFAADNGYLDVVETLLNQPELDLDCRNIFSKNAYQLAATQEIKDAIAKRQNMLKKTSEALEKQVLEGLERFQLDK